MLRLTHLEPGSKIPSLLPAPKLHKLLTLQKQAADPSLVASGLCTWPCLAWMTQAVDVQMLGAVLSTTVSHRQVA
jgi:hypothetical protein